MDARGFLGLTPSHNPFRWTLPVTQRICLADGNGFLFGGCGLGAALSALEGTSERKVIWATAQYLSYAEPGEVMDVDVTLAASGHQVTQARAVGHVGNREVLTVNAALGDRPGMPSAQFETMPVVPPPSECPRLVSRHGDGWLFDFLDERMVKVRPNSERDGTPGDGQSLIWARIPEVIAGVDAATLGILGDFVPRGVGSSLGIRGAGNSLDNTLRVLDLVETEWVLLDVRVHGVERGFGHGLVHMFAEDGTLMATASQSCIVRYWKKADRQQACQGT